MENQVTDPPIEKTPEQIEREMFQTRESLTEKVAALENQVVGTVQNAANTLTDTVDAVKSFVTTAPEAVSDKVDEVATAMSDRIKSIFNVSDRVRDNPWASLGISVGLGFTAGLFLFRNRQSSSETPSVESHARRTVAPQATPSFAPPAYAEPREPGLFDELLGMVQGKVKEMAKMAIESATASIGSTIRESVPKLVDEAARRFVPNHNEVEEPNSPLRDRSPTA